MKVKELLDYDLTHKHAGNGYAIVEVLDNEFVRVAGYTKSHINSQAFLAWTKLLSRTQQPIYKDPLRPRQDELIGYEDKRLNPESMGAISKLREEIKQGTKKIIATHIKTVAL